MLWCLFPTCAVNGDLSNSKKSTLLVEDFIKVDVLLVKVCHKRRKVHVLAFVQNRRWKALQEQLETFGREQPFRFVYFSLNLRQHKH